MKFHEYISQVDVYRKCGNLPFHYDPCRFYAESLTQMGEHKTAETATLISAGAAEMYWWHAARPYYKVWPAITNQLTKIALDIKPISAGLVSRTILIRFGVGCEIHVGRDCVKSVLCSLQDHEKRGYQSLITVGSMRVGDSDRQMMVPMFRFIDDSETIEEYVKHIPGWATDAINPTESELMETGQIPEILTRIALTVLLLADDPSIITPDVLAKDRDRYDRETDEEWKQRAVERAKRRGVVGWNIGADYEVCPHYRRPHFGLRHTGKGRTVPRIVPIKGAVVHRSRLTEVPTGYQLPDGTEVEHGKVVSHV